MGHLPTTAVAGGRSTRGRKIKKTFNNLKITILCGFVTILVLRGTIGINLSGPASDSDTKVAEDIDRILREIRSDSEPDDDDVSAAFNSTAAASPSNVTLSSAVNYTLGPKIYDWDKQRGVVGGETWVPEPDPWRETPDPPRHRVTSKSMR